MWAALLATVTGVIIGVPLGLLTGFRDGRIMDAVVSRAFDCLQSIPALILAIAFVAALGRQLTFAMIAVGIAFSPTFYRVSRAAAATVAGESYIEASRSMGQRTAKMVITHVFGNVAAPLIALTSTTFAFGILAEAALSYLGLGVQPPQASLGTMLSTSADLLNSSPQLTIEPGLMIMLLVRHIGYRRRPRRYRLRPGGSLMRPAAAGNAPMTPGSDTTLALEVEALTVALVGRHGQIPVVTAPAWRSPGKRSSGWSANPAPANR